MRFDFKTIIIGLLAGLSLALGNGTALASDDKADAEQLVREAKDTFSDFIDDENMTWMRDKMEEAKAVLIVPRLLKAGFVFGGSGGTGVLLYHDSNTGAWSYPAFYTMGSVSWGLQIGAEAAQVVLMMMTDKGKDAILSTKFQLGGDVSVAAGPAGAGAQAATADVIQFSRTKGLFGGLTLEGSVITIRDALNHAYYDQNVSPTDILVRNTVKNPQADELIREVTDASDVTGATK